MIPQYKNVVHEYDYKPTETQQKESEPHTLIEVDMTEFGIKTRKHKNAHDSDSDDEDSGNPFSQNNPQCRQM